MFLEIEKIKKILRRCRGWKAGKVGNREKSDLKAIELLRTAFSV